MTSKINWVALILTAFIVVIIESRAVPRGIDQVPRASKLMVNPQIMLSRNRRQSYGYPLRTMMMTGFYKPARQDAVGQGSGIYAQGSSIVGGTYFSQPNYSQDGFEPTDDSEIATADAEAAPIAPDSEEEDDEQHQSDKKPQLPSDIPVEEPIHPRRPATKPSKNHPKKNKKVPVPVPVPEEDEEEEYEDEEEEDGDSTIAPIIPQKPNKHGRKFKQYPSLNNFFPMVFSFPSGGAVGRRGSSSSGSSGIPVTAVANSYSTGKTGVASSVATAYGGAPIKKPRPSPSVS